MTASYLRSSRWALCKATIWALAFVLSSCTSPASQMETLTLGVPPLEQAALIYVADAQGFFAQQNLKISITDYDTGVSAIDALLKGDVDIAEAAEFPFVRAVFQKEPITIMASNDKFENDFIVARKDRGIAKIADLKGKRIGVARQTIAEFYLGRALNLQGINIQEVTLVDVKPAQFVNAMTSGQVDAIIAWQPYVHQILAQKNIDLISWNAHSRQAAYSILIARREWIKQHSDTVQRFLKSLAAAEDYLIHNPNQAKAIVRQRLNYDETYMVSVWSQHQIVLALEQSLVIAMKDEGRWMIQNQLTTVKELPNFLDYVNEDLLQVVKPQASSLIR
ncbi:MAG: NrtA/SsuA/CpmA family ABC transporter substrate-binding protein [Chloroflexi bacterium]|nr:NrtA/SsuA/CpmA family ABC transporter substrate-binding protein [Chloroflexota bacterium]